MNTLETLRKAAAEQYAELISNGRKIGRGFHEEEIVLDFGLLGERSITVGFYYYKGYPGNYYEPPEPEEWDISYVMDSFNGVMVDISAALDEDSYEKIIDELRACKG